MTDEELKAKADADAAAAKEAADVVAAAAAAAGGGDATADKDAEIARLRADKDALNKALHNERKSKGGVAPDIESVAKETEELKARLAKAETEKLAMRFTQDATEAELALDYYSKLSAGVTDPKAQEQAMQRAVFLARGDKGAGINIDPVQRMAGAMHGGGRGVTQSDSVQPSTVEIGKLFGNSAESLKPENVSRTPKNLYDK